jgi:hypothetical protein
LCASFVVFKVNLLLLIALLTFVTFVSPWHVLIINWSLSILCLIRQICFLLLYCNFYCLLLSILTYFIILTVAWFLFDMFYILWFVTCYTGLSGTRNKLQSQSQLQLQYHAGRTITSCQLPISAGRVQAQIRSCGICGGQRSTGASFPRELRVSMQILIPPTAPHASSSIIRG